MSAYFLEGLLSLKGIHIGTDIRGFGMMGGIDVAPTKTPAERGHKLQLALYDNGLHIKTTGDSGVIAPPFVMSTDQIDEMVDILGKTLKAM